MSSISNSDYCGDPDKYKNSLPKNIIDQYAANCSNLDAGSNIAIEIKNLAGDFLDSGFVNLFEKTIMSMIMGFLSPAGLEFIGALFGAKITLQTLKTLIVNVLEKGFSDGLNKAASDIYAEGFSAASVAASKLLMGILKEGVEVGLTKSAIIGATRWAIGASVKVVEWAAELLVEITDPLFIPLLVLQFISTLFDMWDPCGLNNYMDSDQLAQVCDSFNNAFKSNIIDSESSDVTTRQSWPVEIPFNFYYAQYMDAQQTAAMNNVCLRYTIEYLSALQYNSVGEAIVWPMDRSLQVFGNNDLSRIARSLDTDFVTLANGNTAVADWLDRHFYLIFFVAVLILLIFLRYIFF
jgi:hypothetical protein